MKLVPDFVHNSTLGHLFLRKHFRVHRIFGIVYLAQWFSALYLYWSNYERFEQSFLVWALPLSGCLQTIIAIRTFTFLPRNDTGQGYFTTKKVMSKDFIEENLYFAIILTFAFFYMTDRLRDNIVAPLLPLEYLFVFFPYQLRWLFPKTSFRTTKVDLSSGKDQNDLNRWFFYGGAMLTKAFFLWAKHFIGFFLNYARFNDRMSPEHQYHMHFMLIMSCCALTVAIFLQTLKFKGYIDARVSFILYAASYLATFIGYIRIYEIFFENSDLMLLALGGLIINFGPKKFHGAYQVLAMLYCTWLRAGSPDLMTETFVGDYVPQNVTDAVEGIGASVMSMFVTDSGVMHSAL